MDFQNSEDEVIEKKSSGLFSLPAVILKKLYSHSDNLLDQKQENKIGLDSIIGEDESELELSEVAKSLLSLIANAKKLFKNSDEFDPIKKLVYEINDPSEANHVLIALTAVLRNLDNAYIIENKDTIFGLPLEILNKFKFSKQYQEKSITLQKKCKKIKSARDLQISLQSIYELFYTVYQDAYADKEELENFLFNIGAQISRIGDKLHSVSEEQASDLKTQDDLNSKMNDAVKLLDENITTSSDLSYLKNTVKEQLNTLQNIVEEERKVVKAQEVRIQKDVKVLASRVNELKLETQELRNKVQREKEQALRDPLTTLYNRQAYNEELSGLIASSKVSPKSLCLLIWDIDHFKKFNDQFGHVVGDKVIKSVADKLRNSLRDDYFLARHGGEEFVMLLPEISVEDAKEFADQVRDDVSNISFLVKGKQVKITISCGISNLQDNDTEQKIFERADKALYLAKEEGRNRVKVNNSSSLT